MSIIWSKDERHCVTYAALLKMHHDVCCGKDDVTTHANMRAYLDAAQGELLPESRRRGAKNFSTVELDNVRHEYRLHAKQLPAVNRCEPLILGKINSASPASVIDDEYLTRLASKLRMLDPKQFHTVLTKVFANHTGTKEN